MTSIRLGRRQLLTLLLGGAVTACGRSSGTGKVAGAAAADAAANRRILRLQNDVDIQNLDPANRHGWYDELVMFAIYSSLCQYKAGDTWGWRLDAADRLVEVDPRTIEFRLKPGIRWTNGFGLLTAEDVKYSFERFLDPHLDADYRGDWAALDGVEIRDPYRGVIHLKQPFSPLFTSTLPYGSGMIVCKKAVEAAGGRIDTNPFATSGPYQLISWVPRERLILRRNELWTGTRPYYDEIHLFPMNMNEGQIAFDAGDLDMARLNSSAVEVAKATAGGAATVSVRPGLEYHWLGMNVQNPKLSDIRVRRAIQQAINVAEVTRAVFGDSVAPAFGPVPPPLLGARTSRLYNFDPDEARRLLKLAGVKSLNLRLDFSQTEEHLSAALVVQSQLASVGIAVEVRAMDTASFIAGRQTKKSPPDSELHIQHFTTAADPSWVTQWFTCKEIGSWNFERRCSPAWDSLSEAAVGEIDLIKRTAYYEALQNQLEESGAYVFLYHGLNAWITRSSIHGAWTPDGKIPLLREITAEPA
jgi:peptide/nickel transport system substrate-binding protein